MHAFVLLNSRAGNADSLALHAALDAQLEPAGWTWEVFERRKGQGRRRACRRAVDRGCDVLVAAGGDGTVCRVADVGTERDVPVGILPVGTGNLIAKELGVPLDLEAAVRALTTGNETRIDAMNTGDRRCFSKVSMGSYAQMSTEVSTADKKRLGRAAYLAALVEQAASVPRWTFSVRVDDAQTELEATTVLVANVGHVGIGGLMWGNDIAPTDGWVDVCLLHPTGPMQLAEILGAAALGAAADSPHLTHLRARRQVHLRCVQAPDGPADDAVVRGDGKAIASGEVTLQVEAGATRVILDAT